MTELTTDERIRILRAFEGVKCFCKKKKSSSMSFCYKCYRLLPERLRKALWRGYGNGYEEAYMTAREWLKERATLKVD